MPDVREYQSVVEEAEQAARAGDFARADLRLRDALRLQETSLGADHPDLASTLNNLAVVCETLGQFDDAELFYRRAYAIASGSLPPGDPLVVTSRENLKDFCTARGLPLEEWPEIGRPEAPAALPPSPPAPAAPAGAPPPARPPRAAAPAPAQTPGVVPRNAAPAPAPWPKRVVGAVVVLAAIGAFVVATSWRGAAPAESPAPAAATPPAPAAPAVPSATEPAAVAPPATPAPAEPAVVTAPPAAGAAPVESAPVESAPAAAAPPAGLRIVIADVCASLSTNGAWRCDPLGATAAPGRASFYTRIASPRPIRVQHRWYRGTALRQNVTLSVGASPSAGYRTFSRQTLTPGAWRVELRAADGTVLHTAAFDIR